MRRKSGSLVKISSCKPEIFAVSSLVRRMGDGSGNSEVQIRSVEEEIRKVEEKIERLEGKIERVEGQIDSCSDHKRRKLLRGEEMLLRGEEAQLWGEIALLRGEKARLRDKEAMIRQGRGLSAGVSEKLLQELTEFMALQKAKYKSKKSVQLSSVSQSIWDTLERQEGFKMMFQDIAPKPKRSSDLAAFGWDDRQERSQADRYIPHISKIAGGRKWTLIDAANNHPTLLSGSFGGWNFKGTTDVAFVHPAILKSEPRRGLGGIFELKKDLRGGREKAVIQTVIRLVMAHVFSEQFKPFAVLTDLDDHWSLYWMDGSTIYWYTFESRAMAVGCIEDLLQDSDYVKVTDVESIKKGRGYEPPGMDNLKDLVGLIPDEEILDARVQLGVQQLQKLLHERF